MAATAEFACQWCKQPFIARLADRKRGWARYCSKSCKASKQERLTGQHASYQDRRERSGNVYEGGEFADAHLFSNEDHDCNKPL